MPHAVDEKFEEKACDVAAEKKGDDGQRADDSLEQAAVGTQEKGVVQEMTDV
jgi:hypothetical protein